MTTTSPILRLIRRYGWTSFTTLVMLAATPLIFGACLNWMHSAATGAIVSLLWLTMTFTRVTVVITARRYSDAGADQRRLTLTLINAYRVKMWISLALFATSVALRLPLPAIITALVALPAAVVTLAVGRRSASFDASEQTESVPPHPSESWRRVIPAAVVMAAAIWTAIILWWTHTASWQIALGIVAVGWVFVIVWILLSIRKS